MPNRYIREDAITSRRVNSLSWQGEVFYRRLLNKVDDFGRYFADPMILLGKIFPRQMDKVTVADLRRLLLECEKAALVSRYKGQDDEEYLLVHTWEKGRAISSKFPEPPAIVCEHAQTKTYSREHLRTDVPDSDTDSDTDTDSDMPWISDPGFAEAWKAWGKSRKKKPTSRQYAALENLASGSIQTAIAILNQSADNGWTGIFPLKGTANGTHRTNRAEALDAGASKLADRFRRASGADRGPNPENGDRDAYPGTGA